MADTLFNAVKTFASRSMMYKRLNVKVVSQLYLIHDAALRLLLLLKQLDPVLEPFLETQQVRCVCFLSGFAGFPLGLNIRL